MPHPSARTPFGGQSGSPRWARARNTALPVCTADTVTAQMHWYMYDTACRSPGCQESCFVGFLCWYLHVKHQGVVLHSCPEVWPCFCCFLTVVRALHFFSLRWVAQAPITMETWFVFPNSFSWTQHLSAWEKEGCKLQVSCTCLWGC